MPEAVETRKMERKTIRKVLIAVHGFPPSELGGTEAYSYNLAKSLSEKGIEVLVFTRLTGRLTGRRLEGDGYVSEDSGKLRVFRVVDSTNNLREFLNPYVSKTFRNLLLREQPDLVHFQHLGFLSGDMPETAAGLGIPGIITLHDYWFICPRIQLLDKDNRRCEGPAGGVNCVACFDTSIINEFRLLNRMKGFVPSRFRTSVKRLKHDVDNKRQTYGSRALEYHFRLGYLKRQFELLRCRISPSEHLIGRYRKEGFTGIRHLPHGFLPSPRMELNPSGRLRAGFMGNINYPKGLAVVVDEIYALLKARELELEVYGQPLDLRYFDEVKRKVKGLPSGAVTFEGGYRNTFEDLSRIFASFDVLFFPSVWEENAPVVIREALLAGRPVIASCLGGVPEIVKEGVNGLLFDPFRRGDLRSKVRRLLTERDLLPGLAKGARETVIDSMETHAGRLMVIYGEALKGECQGR